MPKTPTMSYGMKTAPKVGQMKSSGPAGTATGSGSRPGGGKYTIPCSYPKNMQKIRG